jgi:O-antigen/teichoic acid export membrane protein
LKILLQSLRKNKVVKNAGWIIGGKVANKLLAFVVGIFAARYLGPSNYGLINYAAAYATFFASLCTLGINSVIVKNFVDHPDQQGETIGTTLLLRAISSLLSASGDHRYCQCRGQRRTSYRCGCGAVQHWPYFSGV